MHRGQPLAAFATAAAKDYHHQPHHRTEAIFRDRHGVEIPRHTLPHWD